MRGQHVLATLAGVAALVLGVAAPARADYVSAACSVSNHTLQTYSYYYTSGPNHVWNATEFAISGAGTGGKSNVHLHLYSNGVNVFNWYSPDNIKQDIWYTTNYNVTVNAATLEFMAIRGIFDIFGTDPQCTGRSVPSV